MLICITSFVGIFAVSAALTGYFVKNMLWYERILCVAGGLLLIYPGLTTDLIGLILVGIAAATQLIFKNSKKTA